jgi:hypothetical protein
MDSIEQTTLLSKKTLRVGRVMTALLVLLLCFSHLTS